MSRAFFDTNVLVYLFDRGEPNKRTVSRSIIETCDELPVLSPQVLGEFYVTVTRKLKPALAPEAARTAIESFSEFIVHPLNGLLVRKATRRSQESMLSYRDALIVETALEAGANVLLTEDMQHGQAFDGLIVRNPFF